MARQKDKVKTPKKAKVKKVKKDTVAMRAKNTQRQIDHLGREIEEVKAKIAVSTNAAELAELNETLAGLEESLAIHIAKLAKITGSPPPVVEPVV